MKKRSICALLCVAMLLAMLAGCGSGSSTTTTTTTADEETTQAAEETAEATEATTEDTAAPAETAAEETPAQSEEPEEVEEEVVIGPDYYYVSDETTEITLMFQYPFFFANFFSEGWQSSPWWEAVGEKVNCTFTLTEVPNTTYSEKLNLALVSGDAPDLLTSIGNVYATGASGALHDEMIYDMRPYLEEYAPNYYAALTADENTFRSVLTDDSEIPVLNNLMNEPATISDGLWVRQDWLDALGMDVPTDLDSFYEFLKACKDTYGCTAAYYQMITTGSNTAGIEAEGVWNAFGPCDYFVKEDGTVGYGPAEDYYFDYLNYLKKLADDGLFVTSETTDSSSNDLFAQGNIAVNGDSPENVPNYLILLDDPSSASMTAMAALGEPTEYGSVSSYVNNDGVATASLSVSTTCDHPELIAKMMDYLFTDEGSILATYGIEGLTYEIVDGEPQYTDLIVNNADGIPVRAALGYWTNPGLCAMMISGRLNYTFEDYQLEASDIWASAYTGSSQTLPASALSFTTEEQNTISVYKSDMTTYITEFVYSVVFGGVELTDSVKQEYLDTLENTMHLSEILTVYTDAYERYLNREVN
jgi:putative aldouronate transport system substrate-binding protein